ncbi:MAG: DNA-directed RNA polymerase subunit alpha [Ignavibacteria bacterium]|nr:DNA-directed RNA polymerase subunit alpha [Ignavibacteria bacterium]
MTNTMIQMPEKVQVDDSSTRDSFGRFVVQPLEKGYGVTIGNSLRRILLSSLPGFAITGFSAPGVLHEFTTIKGVVEDVPEFVLNLKQVRLRMLDKKAGRVLVPLKGPMEFKASEIQKAAADVEVLNPDQHIATINSEADFELDLRIGRGIGYVSSDENKTPDQALDVVAIDSVFTPVKNVRYLVETTRVGQQTDYDKLTLEVETDGSVTPQDALVYAAKILREHIQLFIRFEEGEEQGGEEGAGDAESERIRRILITPVDELELSVRSHNCLRAAGIRTIAELVHREEAELLKFRNFGRKSLAELAEVIEGYGLRWGYPVNTYLKEGEQL